MAVLLSPRLTPVLAAQLPPQLTPREGGRRRRVKATLAAVSKILENPAYAGALSHGRTRRRKTAREAATPAKTPRPIGEWRIIVKNRYPAYIDRSTYERIRETFRDNG